MDSLSFLFDFPSNYNTWLIMISLLILGASCSAVGAFAILNKQALISDVAAHATLPGVVIGFLISALGGVESPILSTAIMLSCAALCGGLGVFSVHFLTTHGPLRTDASMSVVLSTFYGLGLTLITVVQRLEGFSAAGLDRFLLGQVTGITYGESLVIFSLSILCLIAVFIMFRPLLWYCFDRTYLKAHHPIMEKWIGYFLAMLIILIICAGLRMVGLVLFVALMIIPVSVVRPWRLPIHGILLGSIFVGMVASYIGVQASSHFSNVPPGAAVVLSCAGMFCVSVLVLNIRKILWRLA